MAISIDWPNKIISVPKADMTLIQSVPTEIRELNLNTFKSTLGDLTDEVEAMPFERPFNYVGPITVGGVSLAAVLEIINSYTITFEDDQYAVNLSGLNSNVGDRVNVNQVSVRSANSAGLTFSKQVEDSAFVNARVWINTLTGSAGTQYPIGTPGVPVSNFSDAAAIITGRGLPKRLHLTGTLNIPALTDISNYDVLGASAILSVIDIDDTATTDDLVIESLTITGDLSGNLTARQSTTLTNLLEFEGTMASCGINGTLEIADNATVLLDSCYSEEAGALQPIIVMGANSTLMLRNYSGGAEIRNMTAGCTISVDLDPGTLDLGPTNIGGTIRVRGTGVINDTSNGATVLKDSLVKADELDLLFFDRKVNFDSNNGTAGETNFPAGTVGRPVADEASAKSIADTIGVRAYEVLGVMDLAEAHTNWFFEGKGGSTARVNIAGEDVAGSKFQSLNVQGTMVAETGIVEIRNGPCGNLSGFRGTVVECGVFGTISLGTAPNNNRFVRCQQGNSAPTFDCTNLGTGQIIFALWDGGMTITNLTSGDIYIDALGIDLTLDSSCTGGNVVLRGIGQITDNSLGSAVDTSGLLVSGSSLSVVQSAQLLEVHKKLGLDSTDPMIHTPTSSASQSGDIVIQRTGDCETQVTEERL